jgi:hypothetical protein
MNGWSITTVAAAGVLSSEATVIVRDSPWMVVNTIVDVNSSNIAVQLPTNPSFGDVVEVCGSSSSNGSGYVWYALTPGSSLYLFQDLGHGQCRSYRYISGPSWNKYS